MDTAAMTESLRSGERDDQVFAAREVCKLNSKQKLKLAENGIIFPLVSMLRLQDYESIEAALYALLHLAFGSERNKVGIVKSGSIPALLKVLLEWRSESLLELALALLLILSSCTANRPEIGSSGAVQVLFRLLGSDYIHRAKLDIISALHNLSTSTRILLSDGLISLIQLLIHASDKSSDIVEKAIELLESLVSSSDTTLNQVSEVEGVMGMLVEAVEDGTNACKEHAAAILVKICKSSRERYRGMILSVGAMPGLLQLSVHGNRRAREKAKALLKLLRDDGGSSSSSSSSRVKHAKSVLFQEVMTRIDRAGSSIEMVEEMIAKLRT